METKKNIKTEKKKAPNTRYLRDKDREKVKGVFNYYENKDGVLRFAFRKYEGDPIEQYELKDGQVYTLPLGVAKHLNTSGAYRTHEYAIGEDGKPKQKIGTPARRYGFQSLEFTKFDDTEEGEKIITVENI